MRRQYNLAFLLCFLGFLIEASVLRHHFGFPLDDSWIHQTVARNLVQYRVLGFLPGTHSSGSSSLLWTVVLALQYVAAPWVSPVLYCLLINAFLIGLIGLLLKSLADRDRLPRAESWILALAPALSGNFLWLGLLGMEHVLFVALSLAALSLWFWTSSSSRTISCIACSLLVGLLALTRPEGILLLGVLFLFRKTARRSWRDLAPPAIAAVLAQCIEFRVNWVASGTLLPLTMKGRAFLYFNQSRPSWLDREDFEVEVFTRFLKIWTSRGFHHLHEEIFLQLLLLLAVLGFLALVGWEAVRTLQAGQGRISALLVWLLGLNLTYLITLPTSGHGGRYQPMMLLLQLPVVAIALLRLATRWAANRRANTRAQVTYALASVLAVSSFLSWFTWWRVAKDGIEQINIEHGEMAQWLVNHVPPADIAERRVAIFDIGRMGYEMHGNLIDLGGLTDPRFLPYLTSGTVAKYLALKDVRFVVLPTFPGNVDPYADRILPTAGPGYRLDELWRTCTSREGFMNAMRATRAALPCQTAYASHFDGH